VPASGKENDTPLIHSPAIYRELPKENWASKAYSSAKKVFFFLTAVACDLALLPGAGLFILFAACYQSNFDPKIHQIKKDKTPILFIHGNGYNEMQWVVGRVLLSKDKSLGSMFSLNLDGLVTNKETHGIDDYAQKVAKKVEEIKKLTGRNDVDLVGHSMGGLVASYFTEHLSAAQNSRVTRVITISTPWAPPILLSQITELTKRWLPTLFTNQKRFQQMRGENGFLDDLKARALSNKKTVYFSLYSTADGIVPGNSGQLGEDPMRTKAYHWMGHYTPMVSFSAWRQVASWLKAPIPSPGTI
jgi:pimeloyl-ACP methyl ester carboxylesterase